MADFELQRNNMVESQVRPSDITDRRIIRAMSALPREAFAAADTRAVAYMDQDLAIGPAGDRGRRFLLSPRILAKLIQSMQIEPGDRVLEIGTGTGYGAAVLGALAKSVLALECDAGLAATATRTIAENGMSNVTVVTGPLTAGWTAEAPYGAILLSGAVPELPDGLIDQLRDGGRLAGVVVSGGVGRLTVWQRFGSTSAVRVAGEANARALPGFGKAPGFVF